MSEDEEAPAATPASGPLGFGTEDDFKIEVPPRPRPRRPQGPPPSTSRYVWFVGVLAILIVGYVTINTATTEHIRPVVAAGAQAPPFAVPLATADLPGDAAVRPRRIGKHPAACDIRGPKIFTSCLLYAGHPAVLVLFAAPDQRCVDEVDRLAAVTRRHPGVRLAAVAIRGARHQADDLARSHRWSFPVGYDHQGDVATLYGFPVCPETIYLRPGGRVFSSTLKEDSVAVIERKLSALERAST